MLEDMEKILVIGLSQQYQRSHQHNYQYFHAFSQFEQYHKNNIAVNHNLRRIIRQAMASLKNNMTYMKNLRFISRSFLSWKIETLQSKVRNRVLFTKVIQKLKENRERKLKKNMRIIMNMTAQNCYERCLKVKLFHEWKQAIEIGKKQKRLQQSRKRKSLNQMMRRIQQSKQAKFIRELSMSLYSQKIKKKSFRGWAELAKMKKVTEVRIAKEKRRLLSGLRLNLKLDKQQIWKIHNDRLMKSCFKKLQENKKNQKCDRWKNKKILRRFLGYWLTALDVLYYEKEEQVKKEEILVSYLKRKSKIQLLYCFEVWANSTKASKDNKNQNQIAKQYAYFREKQFLLRKYFGALKQYKYYRRGDCFYQNNLKLKVFSSLKDNLLKMSQKWQRIYKFVENREKRKYFLSIKKFISSQNQKVRKFQLKGAWNNFTFSLAKNFVQSNKKADEYYQTSLKYKSLFSLKDTVAFKKKSNQAIIFINVNLNLKRWRKAFQIKAFYYNRIYMIKMKIFRQLKLIRMSKVWISSKVFNEQQTQRKRGFYPQQSHFTQASISIQKLNLESPSKLFSLEYSISGYNSNNLQDNF